MVMTKFVQASKLSEWCGIHLGIGWGRSVSLKTGEIIAQIPKGSIGCCRPIKSPAEAEKFYRLYQEYGLNNDR